MKDAAPKRIYLKDYQAPSHLISHVELTFDLHDECTKVKSKLSMIPNSSSSELTLNGIDLTLLSVRVDGQALSPEQYTLGEETLTLHNCPQKSFTLEIENSCNPAANTLLDGLYKSGTIFCTQNEPEGFRRITYFLDRSDVMAKYRTKIIADKQLYPILLSNGNEVGRGELSDGRHWVEWEDPFAKPCYLFALVAGDLGMIQDSFVTQSGRTIDLRIYCDKGNESRCHHAMRSLQKSMKWDEDVFGLEYDLDIYMIVAVDAFNMGAMENKGLNIFNTSCVLADEATATDENFKRVEAVIAHEYFHNWTGNRITCRDWFQLTLKEGLTVFRDQEFSSDMHSRPVKRIEDVVDLRARQFVEDAGPTAHPIQPQSYIQINNFYTATVYDKGAEVIRMIHTLIGAEAFRKGIDLYFAQYDGQAVTTEEFVHSMEQASGKDLSQFRRWYSQAGTPRVSATFAYDEKTQQATLSIQQHCPKTPHEQEEKKPFHFPFAVGLVGSEGKDLSFEYEGKGCRGTVLLEVTEEVQEFVFEKVEERPVPSLNRQFSAPLLLSSNKTQEEELFLMGHDSDAFNRWDAGQELATQLMLEQVEKETLDVNESFMNAFGKILKDEALDHTLRAKALRLPGEGDLAQRQNVIEVDGNHRVREGFLNALAQKYAGEFNDLYQSLHPSSRTGVDSERVAKRALKNTCLSYLVRTEEESFLNLAWKQFEEAQNMTDQFGALACLSQVACPQREEALKEFYQRWKGDLLVMTKWFALQAGSKLPGALDCVRLLMSDPVFDLKIPNLVRALLGAFGQNSIHFHEVSGQGYAFMADRIRELDEINHQMAAGLCGGFKKVGRLDSHRKKLMQKELERIREKPSLSSNVYEIVSECLNL